MTARIDAILLAAGQSRRMGTQKLLLPLAGKTVIAHVADQVLRSPVRRLIVVTSPATRPAIEQAVAGRAVSIAENPDPESDMLASVRVGLRALAGDAEAILVALGDQPSIRAALIESMARAFDAAAGRGIVVPVHSGKRGHPLLFASCYAAEVLTAHDATGLRGLLSAHAADVVEVPAEAAVLEDMDTPEDYRREVGHSTREQRAMGGGDGDRQPGPGA